MIPTSCLIFLVCDASLILSRRVIAAISIHTLSIHIHTYHISSVCELLSFYSMHIRVFPPLERSAVKYEDSVSFFSFISVLFLLLCTFPVFIFGDSGSKNRKWRDVNKKKIHTYENLKFVSMYGISTARRAMHIRTFFVHSQICSNLYKNFTNVKK